MIIHDCEQNSPEWIDARKGIVTASEFSTILAKGRDGKSPSLTRAKYLRRLAGERITGETTEGYRNADTDRGHVMEPQAAAMYALTTDAALTPVGFVTNDAGTVGASPDRLVGDVGMLEIKTATPHVLIEHIEAAIEDPRYFPSEHYAQCQGGLWVCEREWIDLAIFWPRCPLFVRRIYRDENYINKLVVEVIRANSDIDAIVARVRAYMPEAA